MNGIWISLRYSSALPVRALLAIAAWIWSILFLAASWHLAAEPSYQLLFTLAPAKTWSSLFLIDAAALIWRIVDRRPRIGWTRAINAYTCGLWALYIACSVQVRGYLAPDCAGDVAMLLGAIWATLRTDLTVSDRESA